MIARLGVMRNKDAQMKIGAGDVVAYQFHSRHRSTRFPTDELLPGNRVEQTQPALQHHSFFRPFVLLYQELYSTFCRSGSPEKMQRLACVLSLLLVFGLEAICAQLLSGITTELTTAEGDVMEVSDGDSSSFVPAGPASIGSSATSNPSESSTITAIIE